MQLRKTIFSCPSIFKRRVKIEPKQIIRRSLIKDPYFSVCIPQHNRTSFLIEACRSLSNQTFKNFEVCISDDCSTDGRQAELLKFLEESSLSFVYRKQEQNRKYDVNLRSSIELAKGKFCFLLGNDDCLASPTVFEELYNLIQEFKPIGVGITNYKDYMTGKEFRRIRKTGILGSGPEVAATYFRNFSFVSGVLLNRNQSIQHATDRWDGSEMYQMYIACRMIAAGSTFLGIDRVLVRQGIQITGQQVNSYASRPRLNPCPIIERRLPLNLLGRLVADAISPHLEPSIAQKTFEKIFVQIFIFLHPYWLIEYRRIQSWKYALGVCLGMRPRNVLHGIELEPFKKIRLAVLYFWMSLCGLAVPIKLFSLLRPIFNWVSRPSHWNPSKVYACDSN